VNPAAAAGNVTSTMPCTRSARPRWVFSPFPTWSWRLLILTAELHCCLYGRAARVHHPL